VQVVRVSLVDAYFAQRRGHLGVAAARRQMDAWLQEAAIGNWRSPVDVKAKFGTASIIGGGRAVFNISGN